MTYLGYRAAETDKRQLKKHHLIVVFEIKKPQENSPRKGESMDKFAVLADCVYVDHLICMLAEPILR